MKGIYDLVGSVLWDIDHLFTPSLSHVIAFYSAIDDKGKRTPFILYYVPGYVQSLSPHLLKHPAWVPRSD